MKRLYMVFTILAITIIICSVLTFSSNDNHLVESLAIYNNAQVSIAPIQHQSQKILFADGVGTVYEWSNHTLRKHSENSEITKLPTAFFPVDYGVGYIDDGSLYHWTSSGTEKIAEGVTIACWDGKDFLWMNESHSTIFERSDGKKQQLLYIDAQQLGEPVIMLASEKWIILGSYRSEGRFQNTLVYDRQEKLSTSVPLYLDGNDYAYLCDDKLIKIGGKQDTFCCLDLSDMELTKFESGIEADQGVIAASAAYDQTHRVFYVSVFSEPEQPEFYESNSATFAINFQNKSIERIDNYFYSALGISNGDVFGVRRGLFGAWKTVMLS